MVRASINEILLFRCNVVVVEVDKCKSSWEETKQKTIPHVCVLVYTSHGVCFFYPSFSKFFFPFYICHSFALKNTFIFIRKQLIKLDWNGTKLFSFTQSLTLTLFHSSSLNSLSIHKIETAFIIKICESACIAREQKRKFKKIEMASFWWRWWMTKYGWKSILFAVTNAPQFLSPKMIYFIIKSHFIFFLVFFFRSQCTQDVFCIIDLIFLIHRVFCVPIAYFMCIVYILSL